MRTGTALKLTRSPLILVLAQIRFSPVLRMADFVPEIQEAMRKERLVRFNREETQQLVFGGNSMTSNQSVRWVFGNREKTESVILAQDFFIFQVSKYDMFETFLEKLLDLFEVVTGAVELSFASQIGLRYLDLVKPLDGLNVDEFIKPELRGLTAKDLKATSSLHQFVIQSQTDVGALSIRSYENQGGQFLPPDLQTDHLKFNVQSVNEFRILDFDHFSKQEVDIERGSLEERLWSLHDATSAAFTAATTEDAMRTWQKEKQ